MKEKIKREQEFLRSLASYYDLPLALPTKEVQLPDSYSISVDFGTANTTGTFAATDNMITFHTSNSTGIVIDSGSLGDSWISITHDAAVPNFSMPAGYVLATKKEHMDIGNWHQYTQHGSRIFLNEDMLIFEEAHNNLKEYRIAIKVNAITDATWQLQIKKTDIVLQLSSYTALSIPANMELLELELWKRLYVKYAGTHLRTHLLVPTGYVRRAKKL